MYIYSIQFVLKVVLELEIGLKQFKKISKINIFYLMFIIFFNSNSSKKNRLYSAVEDMQILIDVDGIKVSPAFNNDQLYV